MGLACNLLDWMSTHRLPLELFREEETNLWVVVDISAGKVKGSGESAMSALISARMNEADEDVERLFEMSDEEVIAEIRATGEDPDEVAARVQRIAEAAITAVLDGALATTPQKED